ncbi:MAG: tRNA pseudouridine(55) synthase TruB [Candidatus Hydrothermia bacterium]
MDGFLNIYKEKGSTSYDVIRKLKKILKISRIGHAGNLDPMGEGVLVVGVGKATRFLEYIMEESKEYLVKVKLGVLTDTLDKEGKIIDEKPIPEIDQAQVIQVLNKFQGEIEQVPPSYSAIKLDGKRLYEYAREGIYIVPKPRRVKIYKIELINLESDGFRIKVECSSGTYMRALARDIGEALNTYGIVDELVRLRVNGFRLEDAIRLENDEHIKKSLIPIHEGLPFKPVVTISASGLSYFLNGNRVPRRFILKMSSDVRAFNLVKVFDAEQNFLGVGLFTWEGVEPKKVYVPSE